MTVWYNYELIFEVFILFLRITFFTLGVYFMCKAVESFLRAIGWH